MTTGLYEVKSVRQHPDELQRRWFTSEYADLYVWFNGTQIEAFEFCYDKYHDEHILGWRATSGFTHARIDDGEHNILKKGTPIVATDGEFKPLSIIHNFESNARLIDPIIYRFILSRLYKLI